MLETKTSLQRGLAALVALTIIFASLSVLARYLNHDFTILQQVYLRVLAALLLASIIFYKQLNWSKLRHLPSKEWSILALRGFVSYAVGVTLISKAANMTLLGHVAFVGALPFVSLLGFLFLKEKTTWWKIAFVLLSLLGVSLLSIQNYHDILSWNKGDVLAIVATLGFAIGYVTRRWHGDELNNQEITTLTFVFGAIFVCALTFMLGEGAPNIHASLTAWVVVLIGGALNVANLFLTNYAFQHVDAVRAGNLLNLESVWGLLFGLLLYREWPSVQGLIGGSLIVLSVVGMNLYSHRDEAKMAAIEEDLDT